MIEVKNLKKSFGSLNVLKGITTTINKGEKVVVIGPSGSGKSTLLRCINFLDSVDSGKMTLDGKVMFDGPLNKKDKTVSYKCLNFGFAYSPFTLLPNYSVFKNISLVPTTLLRERYKKIKKIAKLNNVEEEIDDVEGKKEVENSFKDFALTNNDLIFINKNNDKANKKEWFNKERDEIRLKCTENLKKVGLEDKNWAYPTQLSFGQQQRVAIAKVASLNAKVLCFDDLTTTESYKAVKNIKDKNRAIIVVTNELEFAKTVSDKVVFMADGEIDAIGTPKEIFEESKSKKLKSFLESFNYKK